MENNDIVAASTSASFTEIQYATSQNFVNSENLCAHAVLKDNLQYYFKFFKSEELKLYSQMTDSEKADFLQKAKEIYNISSFNSNDEFLQLISEHAREQAWIAFLSSINQNIKNAIEKGGNDIDKAKKTFIQNQKYIWRLIKDNDKRWSYITTYQEEQKSSGVDNTPLDHSSENVQNKQSHRQTGKTSMKKQDVKTNSEANDYNHVKSDATNFNSTSSSLSSFREVVLQPTSDAISGKEILIPADGDCLYTSVFVGFLLPAINNEIEFSSRIGALIGANSFNHAAVLQTARRDDHILNVDFLRSDNFKKLIVLFRKHMMLNNMLWGVPDQIKILTEKLNIEIQEYTLNPEGISKVLVKSDSTKPKSKQPIDIINVLRAKANKHEVVIDGEDAHTSAVIIDSALSGHEQHFRLIVTKNVFDNYLKTSESFSKQQNFMVKPTNKSIELGQKSNSNAVGPTIASSNNDNNKHEENDFHDTDQACLSELILNDKNHQRNDVKFIEATFSEIVKQIDTIEFYERQFQKKQITTQERVNFIKNALIIISWRFNEINKKYKYLIYKNNSPDKTNAATWLFAERNWLILDYLADAINQNTDEKALNFFIDTLNIRLNDNDFIDEQCELGKLKKCIPDIQKIISDVVFIGDPDVTTLIAYKEENKNHTSLFLNNIDSFVSFFLDRYLLNKISHAIDSLNIDHFEHIDAVVSEKANISCLFRVLEIIGECSQTISYELRKYDALLPWGGENKAAKNSLLHDLRNQIEHPRGRRKLELIFQHEPEFFKTILKYIMVIKSRTDALKNEIDKISLMDSYFLSLEKPPSLDANTEEYNVAYEFAQYLEKIISIIKDKTKLEVPDISRLLSYTKNNGNDLYKMFLERKIEHNNEKNIEVAVPENEANFLSKVDAAMDFDKIKQLSLDIEHVRKEFRSAYRILTNKKLTVFEIEKALESPCIILNIDDVRKQIKKVINGDIRETIDDFGQKKWVDDFEQKYLRPLVFEKKRDKGNKDEHYVAQLRELAIIK